MKQSILKDKSKFFALRVIRLYKYLCEEIPCHCSEFYSDADSICAVRNQYVLLWRNTICSDDERMDQRVISRCCQYNALLSFADSLPKACG